MLCNNVKISFYINFNIKCGSTCLLVAPVNIVAKNKLKIGILFQKKYFKIFILFIYISI